MTCNFNAKYNKYSFIAASNPKPITKLQGELWRVPCQLQMGMYATTCKFHNSDTVHSEHRISLDNLQICWDFNRFFESGAKSGIMCCCWQLTVLKIFQLPQLQKCMLACDPNRLDSEPDSWKICSLTPRRLRFVICYCNHIKSNKHYDSLI